MFNTKNYIHLNTAALFQNNVFIYRGLEYERIEAFTQRLLTEFPSAQIMSKNSPPSHAVLNSDVQCILSVQMSFNLLNSARSCSILFLNFILLFTVVFFTIEIRFFEL